MASDKPFRSQEDYLIDAMNQAEEEAEKWAEVCRKEKAHDTDKWQVCHRCGEEVCAHCGNTPQNGACYYCKAD